MFLNNGTSILNATNETQVNPFQTGYNFSFRAINNIVYFIIVGANPNPSVNVSLKMLIPTAPPTSQQN